MIQIPTVLILGAGSSSHFGYPLGEPLIAELTRLIGSNELDNLPEMWSRSEAEAFLRRLSRSGHNSIDAFLESNMELAPLGKFLITQQLKKLENIDRLFPPNDSGWYKYLFNSLIADGKQTFHENRLTIVTFNYDRSLEAYLHNALQNRFGLLSDKASEVLSQLPIFHVHGILGEYPDVVYQPQKSIDDLYRISQSIQIISEIADLKDDFCNARFKQASAAISSAERIFFLGFGFHKDNLRRFRSFTIEAMAGKMVRSTTHGLDSLDLVRLIDSLADYGFTSEVFGLTTHCNNFFNRVARLD